MVPIPEDQVAVFEHALEDTWWNHRSVAARRDALMLGLCLCGLRSVEVLNLRLSCVQMSGTVVQVMTRKGGVPRAVTVRVSWMPAFRKVAGEMLTRRLRSGVRGLAFVTRSGGAVAYEQLRRRCREWTRKRLGQAFTPHCLRHSAAVRVYRESRDVLQVQRFLGHRSLQWTNTYLASVVATPTSTAAGFLPATGVATDPGEARNVDPRSTPGLRLFDPDNQGRAG